VLQCVAVYKSVFRWLVDWAGGGVNVFDARRGTAT